MLGVNLSGAEFGDGDKYGWDYKYPTLKDLSYYADKGITLFRLPVKWERLQPTLGGDLDHAELGRLLTFLDNAEKIGGKIIIDIHNFGRYDGKAIGSASVSTESFADFWSKLASAIGDKDAVYGYDLMNEPHGMPSDTAWPDAAQAATDAIRALGDDHAIFVEGEGWAGASNWSRDNPNLLLNDPLNNIVYEAHLYFDKDGSGTYQGSYDAEKASADSGEKRLNSFVSWLEANNAKGFIGEFGAPSDDPRWQVVLDNLLDAMNKYGLSGTYWGAGSWFNGYNVGLLDKSGKAKASLETLLDHVETAADVGVGSASAAAAANSRDDLLTGTAGADQLAGGAGDDVYIVNHLKDVVTERVGEGHDIVRASVSWTLDSSIEDLTLTGTALSGTGNKLNNVLVGNDRANTLTGLGGNDDLDGGAGADTLIGGTGNDTYRVDNVGDKVVEASGEGTDTVVATLSWTLDANIENLTLIGTGAMTGAGNKVDNVVIGNDGASTLYGLNGDDTLSGGAGNDRLEGGEGEDHLDGGAGDDVLIGGQGRDWLTGGAGRDVFVISKDDSKSSGMDRILDFTRGEDWIDLSGIDANTKKGGNQEFSFIGAKAFSHTAGELRYERFDGYTVVQGDTNGDGTADLAFRVDIANYKPIAADFATPRPVTASPVVILPVIAPPVIAPPVITLPVITLPVVTVPVMAGLPDSPLLQRGGTFDGSASMSDTLVGDKGQNSFFFDLDAKTGADTITGFGSNDIFVTKGALTDGNGDGIIKPSRGKLALDGTGDTVVISGISSLRYLGTDDAGLSVYADAATKPKGTIEGKISDDVLTGDAKDAKKNVFFFDTGLDIHLGDDKIGNFGAKDILVTTHALGTTALGASGLVKLVGDAGALGTIELDGTNGAAVQNLEFDGSVEHGGATYYVYSLAGSHADVADLRF